MKEILKKIYYKILMKLSTKKIAYIETFRAYKKKLDLDNPIYFGEKIQWIKLYGRLERYADYVDKYKVREYVEKKISDKYLIKLLGVYDKAEDIDYDKLPNQFVLKCNHGSGYNIICKDKTKLNIDKTNKQLDKWLKEDFSKIKGETQYSNVKRKIVCEEYIEDSNKQLRDYRIFCFDGEPDFILIDNELHGNNPTRDFYDIKWNRLDLRNVEPNSKNELDKPKNLEEMVEVAKKLSKGFPFVRVDLYNIDNKKIFFGELTFTHSGGRKPFSPLEKDIEIAKKINLEEYK